MRVKLFYHSFLSDWNQPGAHFLRGVASELAARGHHVEVFEPHDAWSVSNLIADHGEAPLDATRRQYPQIHVTRYGGDLDLDRALVGAELVIVHEWNSPELVRAIGEHRRRRDGYALLFHDTHPRSISAPDEMERYDLHHYDGVLAFGRVIRDLYLQRRWAARAWVWHQAADVRVFTPLAVEKQHDLVWIGDWGDGERGRELETFLLAPARRLGLRGVMYGGRHPDPAKQAFTRSGLQYTGWIPNRELVRAYARARVAVEVPPRWYSSRLPGVPSIRVFEALACGVPLVSAPWHDNERLFRRGDLVIAHSPSEMTQALRTLLADEDHAHDQAERGLATLRSRHTCRHRVDELLAIAAEIGAADATAIMRAQ